MRQCDGVAYERDGQDGTTEYTMIRGQSTMLLAQASATYESSMMINVVKAFAGVR